MNLLVFFALPISTILFAIVLQKTLKCPILVTITFFSIYLVNLFFLYATEIVTNLANGLIAIFVYTILAFITSFIVKLADNIYERFRKSDLDNNTNNSSGNGNNNNNSNINNNNNSANSNSSNNTNTDSTNSSNANGNYNNTYNRSCFRR